MSTVGAAGLVLTKHHRGHFVAKYMQDRRVKVISSGGWLVRQGELQASGLFGGD